MNIIKPAPSNLNGEKVCPFIPPIISQGPAGVDYKFLPCIGERCRLWDHCQGDYSPKRMSERADERLLMVLNALEGIPFLGSIKGVIGSIKAKLMDRVSSGFKSA